jgi:hypothetical protein
MEQENTTRTAISMKDYDSPSFGYKTLTLIMAQNTEIDRYMFFLANFLPFNIRLKT